MKPAAKRRSNARTIVGLALIALSALIWWEIRQTPFFAGHGLGAAALPNLIAAGLLVLGVMHLLRERRRAVTRHDADSANFRPALWIGSGLAMVAAIVTAGGGFVAAIATLFAFSSRAFGRRALLTDLAIGAVLGLCIYLAFVELLGLSLPAGPIEALL